MIKSPISPTVLRFIVVGGLNTLFGLGLYTVLALTALPTWFILIAAQVVSTVFAFVTTGGLVFRDLNIKRVPRYLLCYALTLTLYWILIEMLTPIVIGGRIGAMLIIVLPMAALTYLLQSRFVFRSPGAQA